MSRFEVPRLFDKPKVKKNWSTETNFFNSPLTTLQLIDLLSEKMEKLRKAEQKEVSVPVTPLVAECPEEGQKVPTEMKLQTLQEFISEKNWN